MTDEEPITESCDDTRCSHCSKPLLQADPVPVDSWAFQGFCDARCSLRYHVRRASWPDDDTTKASRREVIRAVDELIGPEPIGWFASRVEYLSSPEYRQYIDGVVVGLTRDATERLLGYRDTLRQLSNPEDLVDLRVNLQAPMRWLPSSDRLTERLDGLEHSIIDHGWMDLAQFEISSRPLCCIRWDGVFWKMVWHMNQLPVVVESALLGWADIERLATQDQKNLGISTVQPPIQLTEEESKV